MKWWTKIRLEVLKGENSKRAILRHENIHWETLKKIMQYPESPGYYFPRLPVLLKAETRPLS